MKIRVIVFGAMLAVGNASYAEQKTFSPTTTKTLNSQKRQRQSVEGDIISYLVGRGLDESVARSKIYANNILSDAEVREIAAILEVSYDEIIALLASRTLQEKSIDFTDVNTLMAMAHTLKGLNLTPQMREALAKRTQAKVA